MDPERYPERNLNDTLNDTPCVAWKARAHPTFQPAFPANGWLHISGITANSTSKPAAISHAHARFCKQPLKKHISGIAANTKSKPAIPPCYARFCKQPLKKHISGIAANTKSKPAIPHADARFYKQPLKKHISGIAANTKSIPAIPHVDARLCKQALKKPPQTSVASQQRPKQNQPF